MSNELIKEIREAYAKEEGYTSFASIAANVNIVPRDITTIAKRYAETMAEQLQIELVYMRWKCDKMEQALHEISNSNCDYEDWNFKQVHSTECRACSAGKLLEALKQQDKEPPAC